MENVTQALNEVRGLFQKLVGRPAPEIAPYAYAPFPPGTDPVRFAIDEVEHLKKLAEQALLTPVVPAWMPTADIHALEDALVIRIDVPGILREDLRVSVLGGECVVRGERKHAETAVEQPLQLERPWGPFERRFLLPAGSRIDRIAARLDHGILELRVPFEAARKPEEKAIEVS